MLKKYLIIFITLLLIPSLAYTAQKPPFLILNTIPHYTGKIKANWDNKELALSEGQKVKLLKIRKETMKGISSIKKKISILKAEVIEKFEFNSELKEFNSNIDEIATYKIKATKIHLKCAYETKKVLTSEQLDLLMML